MNKDMQPLNYLDMTGQVCGNLTVLKRDGSNSRGDAMFICQCICGRQTRVKGRHLRSGNTKSCGQCWREERRNDKLGRMLGTWRVEEYVGRGKNRNQIYRCVCIKCGEERITGWGNLSRYRAECSCERGVYLLERHRLSLEEQLINAVILNGELKNKSTIWKIRCIGCGREYTKTYQRNIRIRCSCEEHSLSSINNGTEYSPKDTKKANLKKYGLSIEEYDLMVTNQGGVCAICGNPPKDRRLAVDHSHGTGKVRGLLCRKCNLKLAPLEDSFFVLTALKYLSEYQEKPDWLDSLVDR